MSNAQMLEEIQKAIGAHGKWKMRLNIAIKSGRSDVPVTDIRRNNLCEFGQWLHGPTITPEVKVGKPYEVVTRLHTEFHQCAASVMDLALKGQTKEAMALLEGEYTERSEILIRALNKWKGELLAVHSPGVFHNSTFSAERLSISTPSSVICVPPAS